MAPVDFMAAAARLAREGVENGYGGPFGAVVVFGGRVVGASCNRVVELNDPTAHAEIEAIRLASRALGVFDLSGGEIYSTGEPCPMCLAAIHWARLERVVYAMSRHDAAAVGFDDAALFAAMQTPTVAMEQVENAAARTVFELWRDKPDRTPY